MKKLFLFLIFISFSAIAQNKCADFKTGSFRYSDPRFSETIIVRTDSTQTEINKREKWQASGSIEWTSDCEYVLTFKEILPEDTNGMIGTKVFVTITSLTEQGYICEFYVGKRKIEFEMIKIIAQ